MRLFLRADVFGGYDDVFAAEELGIVVVEFFCRNSECAGIVCFALGSDGGGERAGYWRRLMFESSYLFR